MTWPTPQDYNEALQNPQVNFEDADLKGGTPELTPLGLPRAITGGFASVYSVRAGSRRWAVPCFLRDFADHQERYAEIGKHLAAAQLPYTVGFQFLQKGIRVRGHWYPLLKMEWIEGTTFQEFIEANLQNSALLAGLAERWVKMLAALKKNGVAHGDLQHGNVLIAGGDFRLIDYDGMFVRAFTGRASHEVGHRNYQQPGRTEKDFGPYLDHFSGWVIYLSLMALSIDPSLWSRYGGGQEHILFQKEDFDQPRFSRLLRSMRHINDDRIQKYLPLFESFLSMPLPSIVSVADVIGAPVKKRRNSSSPLPGWSARNQLDLFAARKSAESEAHASERGEEKNAGIKPAATGEPVVAGFTPAPPPSEPVVENFTPAPVRFTQPIVRERILAGFYALYMAAVAAIASRGVVPGTEALVVVFAGGTCLVMCLLCSYIASEETRARVVLWFGMELRRNRCRIVQLGASLLSERMTRLDLKESQQLKRVSDKHLDAVRWEKDRIAEVKRNLGSWLNELQVLRTRVDQAERDEVERILRRLREKHDAIQAEGSAFMTAIRKDELKPRDLRKFMKWKKFFDDLAQAGPPGAISSEERLSIRKRYDRERRSLRRSEFFARTRARTKIIGIRRIREGRQHRLNLKRDAIKSRTGLRRQRLQETIDHARGRLALYRLELVQDTAEMSRYRNIRFSKFILHVLGFPSKSIGCA